jgi:peptidoglycan/LPS O-acetylase OafA/YrhL
LLTVLSVTWGLGWWVLLADEFANLNQHILAGATFTTNFRLLHEIGYFDKRSDLKPLLHLWSLSIEEQFYLVWPLLLFALYRMQKKVPLLLSVGTLTISSSAAYFMVLPKAPQWAFYMLPTRFWAQLQ